VSAAFDLSPVATIHLVRQAVFVASLDARGPAYSLCGEDAGRDFYVIGDGRSAREAPHTMDAHARTGHRACQSCREAALRPI
jgi:hypothetical protein